MALNWLSCCVARESDSLRDLPDSERVGRPCSPSLDDAFFECAETELELLELRPGPSSPSKSSSARAALKAWLGSKTVPAATSSLPGWMCRSAKATAQAKDLSRYKVLISESVPGLNVSNVAEDLSEEQWNEESLIVKTLVQMRARSVVTGPRVGQTREMTFFVKTGIPWEKVKAFVRMTVGYAADADETPQKRAEDVVARHEVSIQDDQVVLVESTYTVTTPPLDLKLFFALQSDGNGGVGEFLFGTAVEHREGAIEHRVVRDFMEAGFTEASKRLGWAMLEEVRRRSVSP